MQNNVLKTDQSESVETMAVSGSSELHKGQRFLCNSCGYEEAISADRIPIATARRERFSYEEAVRRNKPQVRYWHDAAAKQIWSALQHQRIDIPVEVRS